MNSKMIIAGSVFGVLALTTPVLAQSTDSSKGAMPGATNGMSSSMSTGTTNGGEAVPSANAKSATGTGDNAVLNAPGEKPPGTTGTSQPSSLNGQ